MKKDFQHATTTPSNSPEKIPVNSVSIDAVNFIIENVFDWETHKEHAGLRMTYEDCKTLVKSLTANLHATCPDVRDYDVTELYGELLHNNWAGQFQDIKDLTEKVVLSYLEAEMGNMEPISALKRQMRGKINFMEAHYSDVSHKDDVPMHVLAETIDKKSGFGENLQNRKASVLALVQEKRGGTDLNGNVLDEENDPELLRIMTALTDATTDEELVEALEAFEDYMVQDELKAVIKAGQAPVLVESVSQQAPATTLSARIKQKLPGLSRFFS